MKKYHKTCFFDMKLFQDEKKTFSTQPVEGHGGRILYISYIKKHNNVKHPFLVRQHLNSSVVFISLDLCLIK